MTATPMEGVVPIVLTPFDAEDRIDEESLRRLVEFNIDAGVHGLGVAIGSEMFKLNEAERAEITRIVVDQVRKRVPVVINTGAGGTDLAVFYSRNAEALGADAVMVIPPSFMPAGPDEIFAYYQAIAGAISIPVVMQDIPAAPISTGLARRIAEACENVRYIKVETLPIVPRVADMIAGAGDMLTVFGGAGGSYFIEEMRRGSRGTMPFPSQPAAFVEVWNRFRAGDEVGARAVFDSTIMAINRIAVQSSDLFYHVHKQILVRLGVIATARVRHPTGQVDPVTQRELDAILEGLIPART